MWLLVKKTRRLAHDGSALAKYQRGRLGALPSPLWGGVGGGGRCLGQHQRFTASPPSSHPSPSRLRACPLPANFRSDQTPAGRGLVGGREHTECGEGADPCAAAASPGILTPARRDRSWRLRRGAARGG